MNPRRPPLLLLLALAALTLAPRDSDAQTTGGSFGGSRWGSGAPSAQKQAPPPRYNPPPPPRYDPPPPPRYDPPPQPSAPRRTKVYPTKNWGSDYRVRQTSHDSGDSSCAGSTALLSLGLMAAMAISLGRPRR